MIQAEEKSLTELQKFKEAIDKSKGQPFAVYTFAQKELKWSPVDVMALIDMKIVKRKSFGDSKNKFLYSWDGGKPSIDLIKKIVKKRKTLQNKKNTERQRNKKNKLKPEIPAAPLAVPVPLPTGEETPAFNNHSPEMESKAAPVKPYPAGEEEIPVKSGSIPISVEVVTEGNVKTVTIKITV